MTTHLFRSALAFSMLLSVSAVGCADPDDDGVDASEDAVKARTVASKQQLECSGSLEWAPSGGDGYTPQGGGERFGAVAVSLTIANPSDETFEDDVWNEAVNKLVQGTVKHDDKDLGEVEFRVAERIKDRVDLRGKVGNSSWGIAIPVKVLGKSGTLKEQFRFSWSARGGQAVGNLDCTSKVTTAK